MRESKIERYLHEQVTLAGGTTRKQKGRVNDPDRLVIWPGGVVHFIEVKRPGEKPRPGQARELKRLNDLGCKTFVFDNKPDIDIYIALHRGKRK